MTFLDMLGAAERQNHSMLCVGLDPEPARFPGQLKGDAGKIYDCCAAIVDAKRGDIGSTAQQYAIEALRALRRRRRHAVALHGF